MGFLDFHKKQPNTTEHAVPSKLPSLASGNTIVSASEQLLIEVSTDLPCNNSIRLPIAEIATLGGGLASLLPSLRTITQTVSTSGTGLFQLANAGIGDVLKIAKDGSFWGAMKTTAGTSKMAKLVEAGSINATTKTVAAINPTMLVMAVALANIEKRLGDIADMEKQILSFLEQDKEAAIEGDLKTLTNMVEEYKYNWDNELYCTNHHMQVLDIKRSAEQNIIFYQKQIGEATKTNLGLLFVNATADVAQEALKKRFWYYKLSLYLYSFASMMEVMLSGNIQSEYIEQIQAGIEAYSVKYGQYYSECCRRIERMTVSTIEVQALKGLGEACKTMSGLFGDQGAVAEWFSDRSADIYSSEKRYEENAMERFSQIEDPGNSVFMDYLHQVKWLFGATHQVFFDKDSVYLVSGDAE